MTTLTLILLIIGGDVSEQRKVILTEFANTIDAQPDEMRHLLIALAWSESDFRHNIVSHAGACGILQLMPKWAGASCDTLKNDIPYAVDAAVEELTKWERNCGRDWMIASWNQGYNCCKGGWYYRKRKGKQEFNCSPRAVAFQKKVWRRVKYVERRVGK